MAVWSEVSIPELSLTNRLDPEYYQPIYLDNLNFLKNRCAHEVVPLGRLLSSISGGATPSGAEYPEEGIPFLRVQNIMPGYLNLNDVVYIPESVHFGELKRSRLFPGDVLLTITGVSYGKSAYVPPTLGEANINQHSVRMSLTPDVLPEYLTTFLNSRFGRLQSDMKITGITRPALDYGEIRTILVPILPMPHQERIRRVMHKAEQTRQHSREIYFEAETLLLEELGLDTLDLSHELTYERTFSEAARAGRYDAQYYHPEKEQVLEQLAKLPGQSIGDYFNPIDDLFAPSSADIGEFVQNYDLTQALRFFLHDIEATNTFELGSAKKRFQHGDVVVSRLRSYLKEIALVETSPSANCVGSSEFIVLRPTGPTVSAELLVVYLRSSPVQKILKWCQDGSNHPRFKDEELLSIKLPDRILIVQDEIKRIIRKAIEAYSDAIELLEDAKRRVEQMILAGASSHVA
jgi:type I restriction enzyme, S subunit